MTENDPRQGEPSQHSVVAVADWHLGETAKVLRAVVSDIEAGKFGPAKELGATVAALRKALEAVFSERAKLERLGAAEGARDGELDLGAARTEIRRRLDRLRAVSGARGFSGEPE